MYAHNQLLSSILNIDVYVCMYICMYVCMYVLQSYEEHETLRVTMKDGRAAGAKLLEGFKVVRATYIMIICMYAQYVCMYVCYFE